MSGFDDTVDAGAIAAPGSAPAPLPGPQVLAARYEITALLGVGGMGCVYRARDTKLDEIVALKTLRHELVRDPAAVARFRREVKLARAVTHPNVARVFDLGEHQDEPFLTMELIDGDSLSRTIAERAPCSLEETLRVALAICEGITAVHDAGIVHRDLKPDNVLVARDGRVVITDFGIANLRLDSGETERFAGTPQYMAPEQVDGSSPIDARTDIYAIGAILYELLTGCAAWGREGDSPVLVAVERLQQGPPDPRARRSEIPATMAAVVLSAMARRQADRFADARALAAALRDATSSAREPARAPRVASPLGEVPAVDKTVAVLPLRNAGAPEDAFVADGLTDDLIDTLSMTAGLRVRPRSHAASLSDPAADAQALGRELGVGIVIAGSVRASAQSLVLTVRVLTVQDGFQLWAKRFDGSRANALAMSDAAARAIADVLTVELDAPRRTGADEGDAADLYLRARVEFYRSWATGAKGAVALFEQAAALAPSDPNILSGFARALARLPMWGEGDATSLERARAIAARAVQVAPTNGKAWAATAEASWHGGDVVGAMRALLKGLEVAPQVAMLHDLSGRLLLEAGMVTEARQRLETALAFEPGAVAAGVDLARAHALFGEWEACDRLLERPFKGELTAVYRTTSKLRFALWRGRLGDEADDPVYHPIFRAAIAGEPIAGRWAGRLEKIIRQIPGGRLRPLVVQKAAEVYGYVGDAEMAIQMIERAITANLFDILWMDRCPVLASARSHPRWAALHAEVAERASRVAALIERHSVD